MAPKDPHGKSEGHDFGTYLVWTSGMKSRSLLFLLLAFSLKVSAQLEMPGGGYKVLATVIDGDTMPIIHLAPAEIYASISPEAAAKMKSFLKLRRDVLRAYPYAKLAAVQLKFINDSVAHISNERAKKKFIKKTEAELKDQFERDLKKLTVTQGRILIKLIDRETGSTSYALVKELRGGLQAFFWQGLARLFGSNLKSEYKADAEDQLIESIVQQIERGELKFQTVSK
ncbi:MAG: DUF4294 domain-containing protein [Bacteroidetes bacterium]|jgi:hypothetical protein|nr:DUF4294 domain-containing protein [Bacteroidota bacterium]